MNIYYNSYKLFFNENLELVSTRRSHLEIMEHNGTRNVALTSRLFRGFVFIATITENPDSHK